MAFSRGGRLAKIGDDRRLESERRFIHDVAQTGNRMSIARDRIDAHHMLLTPGTRLGPYTIATLIGSGGMGEVYKAYDERLNRTVAIKRMIADDVSRFQSEARAIAAINDSARLPDL